MKKGGGIKPREKVLVIGASGSVGTAMVQLARHFDGEVTGVCSARNAEMVRSLGATEVIDYKQTDIKLLSAQYDVICETVGNLSVKEAKRLLKPGGRLLMVMAGLGDMLRSAFSKNIVAGPAYEDPKHLAMLADLVKKGAFQVKIDQIFDFEQIVAAHRVVDTGHKRGNVVVRVSIQN